MPALEVAQWSRFEEDFGPLTVQERLDGVIQATSGQKPQWRVVGRGNHDLRWLGQLTPGD